MYFNTQENKTYVVSTSPDFIWKNHRLPSDIPSTGEISIKRTSSFKRVYKALTPNIQLYLCPNIEPDIPETTTCFQVFGDSWIKLLTVCVIQHGRVQLFWSEPAGVVLPFATWQLAIWRHIFLGIICKMKIPAVAVVARVSALWVGWCSPESFPLMSECPKVPEL